MKANPPLRGAWVYHLCTYNLIFLSDDEEINVTSAFLILITANRVDIILMILEFLIIKGLDLSVIFERDDFIPTVLFPQCATSSCPFFYYFP